MSHWFFNVYTDAVMKEVKMGMGKKGESGDFLASCMQMTLLYAVGRRPKGNGGTLC